MEACCGMGCVRCSFLGGITLKSSLFLLSRETETDTQSGRQSAAKPNGWARQVGGTGQAKFRLQLARRPGTGTQ